MPDYFSHKIVAERIYDKLGDKKKLIESKDLYLLGAQGPDIFFAYNYKFTRTNLGKEMHNSDPRQLFEDLSKGDLSYCAGFATHYALDTTLHPVVYAYENMHRSPFAHQRFENDLGLYISKFYGVRRGILPKESILAQTFNVYDSIRFFRPTVTVTGIERCLKRHFTYTRYLYKTKRQNYKCKFDFLSLSGVIEEGENLGLAAVKCVLSGDIDGAIFKSSFLQK